MTSRKRYAVVGVGGRSVMFRNAVLKTHAEYAEMVAYCDHNEGRAKLAAQEAKEMGADVPLYGGDEFERMIQETKPDTVIVTTRDSAHDDYICKAMELGCDVVTEKPMTIDGPRCQRIVDTQRKTGRSCCVTFNYRYSPPRTQVKELLMSGLIGEVLSVDFQWLLDTHHGADYFRRWHRNKENSGGLMVHKATHHFDLVNWWLGTVPERVLATGHRHFYLPKTGDRYGFTNRTERCLDCPESKRCPFFLDLAGNERLKELYLDNETFDGYFRDRCVFSDKIDIEDSMNVLVDYANGAKMTYSLNAFCPWEGYVVNFNGTRGRLEHKCQETVYINSDGSVPGMLKPEGTSIRIFPHWQDAYEIPIWKGTGGHGGGDNPLLDDIFLPNPEEDKYLRAADQRSGAWSILTGVAANRAMAEGRPVRIDELCTGIGIPDYAPMPTGEEPLPLKGIKPRKN